MAQTRDCRVECRDDAPLTREAKVQIGALTGSVAVLGVLATSGKKPATRAAVAGGAAGLAAAASTLWATYVARKRCELICEAVNKVIAGEDPVVNKALLVAVQWAIEVVQITHPLWRPFSEKCDDGDVMCWSLAKLGPYVLPHLPQPEWADETD